MSRLLLFGALLATAAMWLPQAGAHLGSSHERMAAIPLLLIGFSYVAFVLLGRRSLKERLKGLGLGLAFVLWGTELVLPPGPWISPIDCVVVSIFVLDLGWMMMGATVFQQTGSLLRKRKPSRLETKPAPKA